MPLRPHKLSTQPDAYLDGPGRHPARFCAPRRHVNANARNPAIRKSIFALAIGAIFAASAYASAQASAQTTTIIKERPGHITVVKRKPMKKVVVVKERTPRRVVHVHRDGSRTVVVRPRPTRQITLIRRD
ncbi:MAG: hypothetical protein FJX54_03175 [Alphaproteobacteria bacterium]|nr:hypothetical protein [Alphaproteobacteria bacterium]